MKQCQHQITGILHMRGSRFKSMSRACCSLWGLGSITITIIIAIVIAIMIRCQEAMALALHGGATSEMFSGSGWSPGGGGLAAVAWVVRIRI